MFYHLKAFLNQCDYFRKNGQYHQRIHLYAHLDIAKEKEDEEAAQQILAIIQREKDRQFWHKMSYAMGRQRGGACFRVQVEQRGGTTAEYTSQLELQEAIWNNIHRKQFYLAESATLCQVPLHGTFRYNAICDTSQRILDGTYDYPQDFDEATKEILQECVLIRLKILASLVKTLITKEDWGSHWRKAKEEMSSSVSGRHFSHYKAGLRSYYISHLQSLFSSLIIKRGVVLDRWS